MLKKSRLEDPPVVFDVLEKISDFEDFGLEDLRWNPFEVVLRIDSFGTKLVEADRKFADGGTAYLFSIYFASSVVVLILASFFVRRARLLKERDEAMAYCESAKRAFRVAMRKQKEEVAAREAAETEKDTVVEQVCVLIRNVEDAEKNFAFTTKALKKLEGLESKVVELEETMK